MDLDFYSKPTVVRSFSSSVYDTGLVMNPFMPDMKAYLLKVSSSYAVQQHKYGSLSSFKQADLNRLRRAIAT